MNLGNTSILKKYNFAQLYKFESTKLTSYILMIDLFNLYKIF